MRVPLTVVEHQLLCGDDPGATMVDARRSAPARNAALFADYSSGLSSDELARTYGISAVRVRQIIARLRERRNEETRAARQPDLISPAQVGARAHTALRRAGIVRWSQIAEMDERSIARIPWIGSVLAAQIVADRVNRI